MKKINHETPSKTPIKNWQFWTPDDDLAILESSGEKQQHELFSDLVLQMPSFQQNNCQESIQQQSFEDVASNQSQSQAEQKSVSLALNTVSNEKMHQHNNKQNKLILKVRDGNRKGCTCKNSKCQKNYCDCFRLGYTCQPSICNCQGCQNTQIKQIHRQNLKKTLEFKQGAAKGCKCKNSKCVKKYCQCHNGGKKCSILCQCIECLNKDEESQIRQLESCRKIRKLELPEADKENQIGYGVYK